MILVSLFPTLLILFILLIIKPEVKIIHHYNIIRNHTEFFTMHGCQVSMVVSSACQTSNPLFGMFEVAIHFVESFLIYQENCIPEHTSLKASTSMVWYWEGMGMSINIMNQVLSEWQARNL